MRGIKGSSGLKQQVGAGAEERTAAREEPVPCGVSGGSFFLCRWGKHHRKGGCFKAPEIELNRRLTCGCIVSATRKITARCRWRCPRWCSLIAPALIRTHPLAWQSRTVPSALVPSIPGSGDWGPLRCALEVAVMSPSPPLPLPLPQRVPPSSSLGFKSEKSCRTSSSRPDKRERNYLYLGMDLFPT